MVLSETCGQIDFAANAPGSRGMPAPNRTREGFTVRQPAEEGKLTHPARSEDSCGLQCQGT